jgi:hypothetical protein
LIAMRGKRPTLAAFAALGMVLAQVAGCGGCVKDEQSNPAAAGGRKPIDLRAADKRLSQFTTPDGAADASTD